MISLPVPEQKDALAHGIFRHFDARAKGAQDKHGIPKEYRLIEDMDGAIAEAAYCKFRGIPWEKRINTDPHAPDVGDNTQIRSTRWPDGRLRLQKDDLDHQDFVLVRQRVCFDVVGYIRCWRGKEVASEEMHRDGHSALYVPTKYLKDFPEQDELF